MKMITIITPDYNNEYIIKKEDFVIFLGGTIDNGYSHNWQEKYIALIVALCDIFNKNVVICNPRRSGSNFISFNNEELEKQITWEMRHLDRSNIILMNILPNSQSPISLLELGAYKEKIVALCKKNFYRYMNVYITCQHHNIKFTNNENKFKKFIANIIKNI